MAMKYAIGVVLVLVLTGVGYLVGLKIGEMPKILYEAPSDDANLVQWQKDWRKAGNSIVSATVVSNSGEYMHIYLDYIYSGDHGDKTMACAYAKRKGSPPDWKKWSCNITVILEKRGFTVLRLVMNPDARKIECSDEIEITFYESYGPTYFKKTFPFKKTWVKGEHGLYGKVREIFSTCPDY